MMLEFTQGYSVKVNYSASCPESKELVELPHPPAVNAANIASITTATNVLCLIDFPS